MSPKGGANRGIAQLVEYRSPKPWVAGSNPPAPAMSNGQNRSGREKTRKTEISRDFSVFFDPNFFRISIDPVSIFFRVEGFELPKAFLREEGGTRERDGRSKRDGKAADFAFSAPQFVPAKAALFLRGELSAERLTEGCCGSAGSGVVPHNRE